jgi:hypothetical protein
MEEGLFAAQATRLPEQTGKKKSRPAPLRMTVLKLREERAAGKMPGFAANTAAVP